MSKKSVIKNSPRFRHAPQADAKKYIVNDFEESDWSLVPDYKYMNSLKKSGLLDERKRLQDVEFTTKASELKNGQLTAEQMALNKRPINVARTAFVCSDVTILLYFFVFLINFCL